MIDSFTKKHRFLSNFYPSPLIYRGKTYPSVEHAYQVMKTFDLESRRMIRNASSPGEAKKMGRKVKLRDDWEDIKTEVMRELVFIKFQNAELREKLLSTGEEFLVEGNHWGDTFWGVCNGKGRNWLGHILMQVRDEIK